MGLRPKTGQRRDFGEHGYRSSTLDDETVKAVLREYGYVNADVTIGEQLDIDQLIDGVMDNRVYLPSLVAVNKADRIEPDYLPKVEVVSKSETPSGVFKNDRPLPKRPHRYCREGVLNRELHGQPGRGVDREEPLILREGDS